MGGEANHPYENVPAPKASGSTGNGGVTPPAPAPDFVHLTDGTPPPGGFTTSEGDD